MITPQDRADMTAWLTTNGIRRHDTPTIDALIRLFRALEGGKESRDLVQS